MAALASPVLITGRCGMLAHALNQLLRSRAGRVVALSRTELDITDAEQVRQAFAMHRPAVLLNCAAHTAVDRCEEEPGIADQVNGHAVGLLAECCREYHTRLVHFSTDAVFGGQDRTPRRWDDPTGPLSAYARSKLLGEQLLQQVAPEGWMIARTAWLFGTGGSCFPRTILQRAAERQPLRVVDDQIGSPSYTIDVAEATIRLIEQGVVGVWHVVNAGQATWYELAEATLEAAEMSADLQPISTTQWRQVHPWHAPRPEYSVLDLARTQHALGRPMPAWRDAIRRFVCQELAMPADKDSGRPQPPASSVAVPVGLPLKGLVDGSVGQSPAGTLDSPSALRYDGDVKTGIIFVDHGSRLPESNLLMDEVARAFARRFSERYAIVEPAHMEIAEPSIGTAYARCVQRGAQHVIVCPYFLGPGKHWTHDIPRLAAEAQRQHPGSSYQVTATLGLDDLMLDLLAKRIEQSRTDER